MTKYDGEVDENNEEHDDQERTPRSRDALDDEVDEEQEDTGGEQRRGEDIAPAGGCGLFSHGLCKETDRHPSRGRDRQSSEQDDECCERPNAKSSIREIRVYEVGDREVATPEIGIGEVAPPSCSPRNERPRRSWPWKSDSADTAPPDSCHGTPRPYGREGTMDVCRYRSSGGHDRFIEGPLNSGASDPSGENTRSSAGTSTRIGSPASCPIRISSPM
jgi:hypothetical protein